MPLNTEFTGKVIDNIKSIITKEYSSLKSIIDSENKNLIYFKKSILEQSNVIYINDFISTLSNSGDKIIIPLDIINNTLYNINSDKVNNPLFSIASNKNIDKIVKLYIISFCNSYINRQNAKDKLILYNELINLSKVRINYILKRYYFNVQKSLLSGKSYTFNTVNFSLFIIGKATRHKYNKTKQLKLKIDWGESYKYLKRVAKTKDPDLLDQFNSGYITRKEFVERMRKYNIKWFMYSTKDINYWVRLHTSHCTNSNGIMYNITPSNFIGNPSKSQIEFTNNNPTVEAVINYEHMGLKDKLRALERVNIDYCKTTFKNTLNVI